MKTVIEFSGAYPFDSASELMQDIFWIFEPYTSQRHRVPSLEAAEMRSIVEAVGSRIDAHTLGGSPRQKGSSIHPGQLFAIVEEFLKKESLPQG